mgnify:CR=1 FL=1
MACEWSVSEFPLVVAPREAAEARVASLSTELAQREAELDTFKRDLHELQSRYLSEIGVLYAELDPLDAALAEAEIRAGLRPPPEDDHKQGAPEAPVDTTQVTRGAPSADLKRAFRDLAKAIHPDLAFDEAARYRRH